MPQTDQQVAPQPQPIFLCVSPGTDRIGLHYAPCLSPSRCAVSRKTTTGPRTQPRRGKASPSTNVRLVLFSHICIKDTYHHIENTTLVFDVVGKIVAKRGGGGGKSQTFVVAVFGKNKTTTGFASL